MCATSAWEVRYVILGVGIVVVEVETEVKKR